MSSFDAYVEGLASAVDRAALGRVRDLVAAEEPEAVEGTSYGVPAFTLHGKPLLGVRAAAEHLSVFPFSAAVVASVVAAVGGRLDGFGLSKGTIRFTAETPIPDDVLRDLVRLRRAEILA